MTELTDSDRVDWFLSHFHVCEKKDIISQKMVFRLRAYPAPLCSNCRDMGYPCDRKEIDKVIQNEE